MGIVIAVLVGGAVGSLMRYVVAKTFQEWAGIEFPVGTLVVNLVGSFLIGLFYSWLVEGLAVPPQVRALLITGFLGGLTTFSTFSYESFYMLMNGELGKGIMYLLVTNGLGLLMVWAGYTLGRVV
ncbi:CrcB protein [Thermocrinis albus DSM 14484]|uniref:Fluoride-specific ion channel FluC n=1 Tax=Thermocrinis albus (strain DSM 14484 / JCM 11386 / HI 11/12) TaxID=638303 RepID=D3SME5_THEAH|nr:fluoride efflux transporter CrcB [Thermocrinis albus]ADC89925.1 CrcB protein [Thermocrinis albus DSM 14484]